MTDSLTLIDMFVRGIAVGAMAVTGLAFLASKAEPKVRFVTALLSLTIILWLITESGTLSSLLRDFRILTDLPSYPVAGVFWLFAVVVFDDRRVAPAYWIPVAVLLLVGLLRYVLPEPQERWLWAAGNIFSGALSAHVVLIIVRGWSGDLLESRRRLRGLVLGSAGFLALINVTIALAHAVQPNNQWHMFMTGGPYGVAMFAVVMLAGATLFLQPQPAVFSVFRLPTGGPDVRAEAAEQLMLQSLNALMAADGWRREGLTIGAVSRELGAREHRLRKLINQRLGHRNFADFVNSYRIEAAKVRLGDPREARTTVATIAFDLGYGSLGPFNRAFRAATGSTPTEWRRQALQTSPDLPEAV